MDVWRYTQRRRSHHPTQFDSDRIEATIADHASRAWSCAPAVAAFSSTGFFPIRSLIWCVGPERPTDRPEIGDRRRVSFFLYFLHFLDRFPETCQLWKRSAEKIKHIHFPPFGLYFLQGKRVSAINCICLTPKGNHNSVCLTERIYFRGSGLQQAHKFVNSSICKPH